MSLPTLTIFGQPVSYVEIVAVVTGLTGVYLLIKNNVWNWIWGAISCLLYGIVFWDQKLFSSFILQAIYFLPMQFYGWYLWTRGTSEKKDDLPITTLTHAERVAWMVATVLISFAWGWIMLTYAHAAAAYLDALNLGASVVAQYLQAKRKLENWWLWLAIDVLSVYLYWSQKLYFATLFYAVLLVMAYFGAREWVRIMRLQWNVEEILTDYEKQRSDINP